MSNFIKFINHASVVISNNNKSILTDPWYQGSAFDDGWSLLYENEDRDIRSVLENIDYIWISHEHPDHFSVTFFKNYEEIIKRRNIKIIFQKTRDGRVISYLKFKKFIYIELDDNQNFKIDNNFDIKIQKSDFYDSALIIKIGDKKIFNLNDCPLNNLEDIKLFKKCYGTCDFLLTQFSYAAWKGGKKNLLWRQKAAEEKIKTIKIQAKYLEAKNIIPFASFIYFSDEYNFYLNDSVNKPANLKEKLGNESRMFFLKPYDILNLDNPIGSKDAENFWNKQYEKIKIKNIIPSINKSYNFENLKKAFEGFRNKIFQKNSLLLCQFLAVIPFLNIFQTIVIRLRDIDTTIKLNLVNNSFQVSNESPDVEMRSKSLYLIFNQGYGFDTLTINGCFEECKKNGFVKLTQSLALANLNNIGIYLNLTILKNFKVIILFFKKILQVNKKLNFKYIQSIE